MNVPLNRTLKSIKLFIAAMLALLLLLSGSAFADSFEERRALVGLKLFRTLVTADLELISKTNGDNQVPILLVYAANKSKAEEYQQQLQLIFNSVKQYSFKVKVGDLKKIKSTDKEKFAAIFVAEQLNDEEIDPVVSYGIENKVIVFSPYEGDVERGVLGGISVQATVRPVINMQTLKQSKLSIKPFFLKVAKQYE
jgi:hypothetical protein